MTQLSSEDIDAVCGLVDDLCGITWDESKAYLIEARLRSLAEKQNCENYQDLVRKVRAEVVPGLKEEVVDAVTTNETLWFRDSSPFRAIQFKLMPEIIDKKAETVFPKRIRIWSAACSTGQEAYSIAITLAEMLPDYLDWDIQILGTDISPSAVERASYGAYNKLEMSRGMTPEFLKKYFVEHAGSWRVCDEIRSICSFKQCNLLAPFPHHGPFDVIFCRNVAIYFTEENQRTLFEKLADVLSPEGWLIVGSSESLGRHGERWRPQQHCLANCYQPNNLTATSIV